MPNEARSTAILLQRVAIEQRNMFQNVPDFADGFFEELSSSGKICTMEFRFGYLEFVIAFIEVIIQEQKNEGIDSHNFEKFLEALRPLQVEGMTAN
jgi:hypothetical protein